MTLITNSPNSANVGGGGDLHTLCKEVVAMAVMAGSERWRGAHCIDCLVDVIGRQAQNFYYWSPRKLQ